MKIISYNLREGRASGELAALAEAHDVDLLCLQECDMSNLSEEIGPLHLADATVRNRLGLAVYYRRDRFTSEETRTLALKKSMHDRIMSPAHERLVGTRMYDHKHERELVVASFHAAPLTASYTLRRAQIRAAVAELDQLGPGLPMLMVGDYNYPLFKKRLSKRMLAAGYDLTLSDSTTYTRYKYFRGHFDLATSIGLKIDSVETLPRGISDHMPILVTATYPE